MRLLKNEEKRVLQVAGKEGAANASRALSVLTQKEIHVDTLNIGLLATQDVMSLVKKLEEDDFAIFLDANGDLEGTILLLSTNKTASTFAELIQEKKGIRKLSAEDEDALKELGNILVGAYFTSLSTLSGLNILESTPKMFYNHQVTELVEGIIKKHNGGSEAELVIKSKLGIKAENIYLDVVFILAKASLEKLLHGLVSGGK